MLFTDSHSLVVTFCLHFLSEDRRIFFISLREKDIDLKSFPISSPGSELKYP